jgi:hypothetical protein
MASDLHPYLMYRIGPSVRHREDHQSWDGLILPKDDPWWDSHFPPNGWGCKCYTRAVTEARKKQYEENGIPTAPRLDGTGGGNVPAKTQAPPVKYKTYFNERKGTVEQVPEGVDPAFNWNQGKAARDAGAKAALESAQAKNIEIMSTTMSEEQIAKLNDAGTLVTSEKELKQGFKDFKKHVENMEEPYKDIYSRYAETTELKYDPLRMVAIGYDPEKDYLVYNKRYFNTPKYQQPANIMFSHELAHRYDYLEIKSWENKDFVGAIEAAIKKVQSNIDRYKDLYNAAGNTNPAFDDILSALSDNRIKVTCGHESIYWAKPNSKVLEIFANASYLQANHVNLPEFDGLLNNIMEIAKTMFIKGAKS